MWRHTIKSQKKPTLLCRNQRKGHTKFPSLCEALTHLLSVADLAALWQCNSRDWSSYTHIHTQTQSFSSFYSSFYLCLPLPVGDKKASHKKVNENVGGGHEDFKEQGKKTSICWTGDVSRMKNHIKLDTQLWGECKVDTHLVRKRCVSLHSKGNALCYVANKRDGRFTFWLHGYVSAQRLALKNCFKTEHQTLYDKSFICWTLKYKQSRPDQGYRMQ